MTHQQFGDDAASGMTKRERIAMEVLKALVATWRGFDSSLPEKAVRYADALLAELAKPKDGAK